MENKKVDPMRPAIAILLLATVMLSAVNAFADIGKIGGIGRIGSPVIPSNLPKPPPPTNTVSPKKNDDKSGSDSDSKSEATQLLDISFSQNRVNFQPALRHAIMENEKESPGALYDVVSVIPNNSANPSQAARLNAVYSENMNAVIQQMLALGLQQNRIRTSTEVKEDASNQDVIISSMAQQ